MHIYFQSSCSCTEGNFLPNKTGTTVVVKCISPKVPFEMNKVSFEKKSELFWFENDWFEKKQVGYLNWDKLIQVFKILTSLRRYITLVSSILFLFFSLSSRIPAQSSITHLRLRYLMLLLYISSCYIFVLWHLLTLQLLNALPIF